MMTLKELACFTAVMLVAIAIYALVGRALDREISNQDAVIERHKFYLSQSEQPSIVWTRRDSEIGE